MYKIIIILNLILLAGQFWLTTSRATDGVLLSKTATELTNLETQNHELELDLFQASSLVEISRQAQALHLVPVQTVSWNPLQIAQVLP